MLRRPWQRIGRHPLECRGGRSLARRPRIPLAPTDHQRLAHASGALRILESASRQICDRARRGTHRADLPYPVRGVQQIRASAHRRVGGSLMALVRSLLYAAVFYPATVLWVLVGLVLSVFGRRPTLAVVLSWADFHHWLARHVLGIRLRLEGAIPPGTRLIAAKHQSMFETLELVRLAHLPVIVMKKELADIPLFGLLTRRYGIIAVERSAGAKALRALVEEGREAIATGRPVIIYPEGTRVRVD